MLKHLASVFFCCLSAAIPTTRNETLPCYVLEINKTTKNETLHVVSYCLPTLDSNLKFGVWNASQNPRQWVEASHHLKILRRHQEPFDRDHSPDLLQLEQHSLSTSDIIISIRPRTSSTALVFLHAEPNPTATKPTGTTLCTKNPYPSSCYGKAGAE